MGGDEEWNKAAMTNDTMVAELLLLLNQATSKQTPSPPQQPPKPALSIEWSVRQRRSKAVMVTKKPAPRASPTTPLSWSGATSHSGGGGGGSASGSGGTGDGGSEESSKPQPVSHPKRPETTRSNKMTNEATTSKRPRKKKTLAELKEEEILLLKERRQLKKELATLRVNMDKQRATNENLKRTKLDLQSNPANERGTTVSIQEAMSGQIRNTDSSDPPAPVFPAISPAPDASLLSSPPKSCSEVRKEVTRFVLPDLNLPFEDDCNTEVLSTMWRKLE